MKALRVALIGISAYILVIGTNATISASGPPATPNYSGHLVWLPLVSSVTAAPVIPSVSEGPLAGGVTDISARIFARTNLAAVLQIFYDTIPNFDSARARSTLPVATSSSADDTAVVPLSNLQTETTYYYWFALNGAPPDTLHAFHFKTFPANSTARDFRFALFSDLSYQDQYNAPAYATAASYNPAFVGQIGDFRHDNPGVTPTPIQISNWWTQDKKAIADTLAGIDFRNNIGNDFSFFHVWDDHDYGQNNADSTLPFKDLARQSFIQYFPTYPLAASGDGVYQSFSYGHQAEFFVLDSRWNRSPDGQVDDANKTMLGATQKQWLKAGLSSAQQTGVTWKFIISPSVWNLTAKPEDSWTNFKTEQKELINYIKANQIKNVIVIDGDLHSGGGIDNGSSTTSCAVGWCIPEITVPHTNIFDQQRCSSAVTTCGVWSQGFKYAMESNGLSNAGFGLVDVTPTGVTLRAIRGSDNDVNVQYTVAATP